MDLSGINLKGKGKQVVKFKQELTVVMNNIIKNCNVIIENDTFVSECIINDAKDLIVEIVAIIKWYDGYNTKSAVLDYLRDYDIMDKRFISILEILPEEFEYGLCLIEGRFKLNYVEKVKDEERKIP
jgi:hypothetical protein